MTDSQPEHRNDGPRVIVVGVDGGNASMRAAAYAMGVARRHCSELIAVRVDPYVPSVATVAATSASPCLSPAHDSAVDRRLRDQLISDARTWRTKVSVVVRHGDPATELARAAEESEADMVVLGASKNLRYVLSGSLSQRLLRRQRWVLTVVP